MWLSLSDSFLSIVALAGPAADPAQLLVRARVAGDIERVFPTAAVTHTPQHDYAYRAVVPRTLVATALAAAVDAIDYPNFKDSVTDQARHDTYLECWLAMHELQRRKARRRVPRLTQPPEGNQPTRTKSATSAPADAPAKTAQINPRQLSRFVGQPEDMEFIPTSRDELAGLFEPTPAAPPAKRSRKTRKG